MLKICFLFLLLAVQSVSYAAKELVTLNGILADKVVVLINGKPEIVAVGETKHGIKLLKIIDESAVVEIKGKQTTLQMAAPAGKNKAITKAVSKMEEAQSHFISIKLIFRTWNSMSFEVDYFYDGLQGSLVTLSAKPYFLGSTSDHWRYPYIKILPGRHMETVTISTNADATGNYLSDEVVFEMMWATEKKRGIAAEYRHKEIKEWTQAIQE